MGDAPGAAAPDRGAMGMGDVAVVEVGGAFDPAASSDDAVGDAPGAASLDKGPMGMGDDAVVEVGGALDPAASSDTTDEVDGGAEGSGP